MGSNAISKCAACGYPLVANHAGEMLSCPFCGTINEAIRAIPVPATLFWSSLAFIAGVALSPKIRRQLSKHTG
jgi:hypothetical protein